MSIDATVIVPIKPWRLAKSRLEVDSTGRHDLARAFALDVLDALAASENVARLVLVTAEPGVASKARELGAVVLPDPSPPAGGMLNAAVDRGRAWALDHAPASPVVVVPSDLPALTTRVFDESLGVLSGGDAAFVPDLSERGTTVVWADSARRLRTFYGSESARRHAEDGAVRVTDVDPRIRQDVDTTADLQAACLLGVGVHTHRIVDEACRSGSLAVRHLVCEAERMEPTAVLGEAMRRFTEMLVDADHELEIPACPGWSVSDLTVHLGAAHRWAASLVLSGQPNKPPEVRASEPLAEWYAGQATALLAALAAVEDEHPAPNFTRTGETAGFWKRRQAHETVVHCVDLAQALGAGFGVTPEIGADGVDEVLRVMVAFFQARGRGVDLPGPVTVHAGDVDRAWTVEIRDEAVVVADRGDADAVIAGSAVDLYLGLWGRNDRSALSVRGEAAERFLAGSLTP